MMWDQEDLIAFLPRLVAGHRCGRFTPAEVSGYCLEVADDQTAAQVIRSLTPDLRAHLAEQVAEAPATEAGWAGIQLVNFGAVGRVGRRPETPREQVTRLRAAVEALRRAFGAGETSQA